MQEVKEVLYIDAKIMYKDVEQSLIFTKTDIIGDIQKRILSQYGLSIEQVEFISISFQNRLSMQIGEDYSIFKLSFRQFCEKYIDNVNINVIGDINNTCYFVIHQRKNPNNCDDSCSLYRDSYNEYLNELFAQSLQHSEYHENAYQNRYQNQYQSRDYSRWDYPGHSIHRTQETI